jgi:hypothetical protein
MLLNRPIITDPSLEIPLINIVGSPPIALILDEILVVSIISKEP